MTNRNTFVTTSGFDRKLIEISKSGEIIRKIGGKGKGPGEFSFIYSFSKSDNKYYVCDYQNYRLSVFDSDLRFENSFILFHNYINEVVAYRNQLLLFGKCCKDLYNQQDEYYLADLYEKDSTNYVF